MTDAHSLDIPPAFPDPSHRPRGAGGVAGTPELALITLGRAELRRTGAGGAELVTLQPKRLALLAYLTVAAPGGVVRRDLLLPLLWAELDTPRARNALNKAVFHLRQVLGDGILMGRGDDAIGLADGTIWCDVTTFDAACKRESWSEAMGLYQGDFLPGLYVSDAPAFEDWVERERVRLARQASRVAVGRAGELLGAGDATGAAEAARQAVALAPDDERAVRHLMALLDRLGDRAGALRAYEDFAARMRREFQVEPDTDTRTLRNSVGGRTLPAEPE